MRTSGPDQDDLGLECFHAPERISSSICPTLLVLEEGGNARCTRDMSGPPSDNSCTVGKHDAVAGSNGNGCDTLGYCTVTSSGGVVLLYPGFMLQ